MLSAQFTVAATGRHRDIRNLFPALPQRPANQQRQKQPGKDESNPLSPCFVLRKIFNKYKQPRKNDQNPYALFGPWQRKILYNLEIQYLGPMKTKNST